MSLKKDGINEKYTAKERPADPAPLPRKKSLHLSDNMLAVVSILQRYIAAGEAAEAELIARIKKDGLADALSWCAASALDHGVAAQLAKYLVSALNKGKWDDSSLRNYAVTELVRSVQSARGTRSTNVLEAPRRVAQAAVWAEIAEVLGAVNRRAL